jgi:hypothetical protein
MDEASVASSTLLSSSIPPVSLQSLPLHPLSEGSYGGLLSFVWAIS